MSTRKRNNAPDGADSSESRAKSKPSAKPKAKAKGKASAKPKASAKVVAKGKARATSKAPAKGKAGARATSKAVAKGKAASKGKAKAGSRATSKPAAKGRATSKGAAKSRAKTKATSKAAPADGVVRKRYFKCVYQNKEGTIVCGGRYSGKKPRQAASKALTGIFKKENVKNIVFGIIECTRNKKKRKINYYKGERMLLKQRLIIRIGKSDTSVKELSEKTLKELREKKTLTDDDRALISSHKYVVYTNNNSIRKAKEEQYSPLRTTIEEAVA